MSDATELKSGNDRITVEAVDAAVAKLLKAFERRFTGPQCPAEKLAEAKRQLGDFEKRALEFLPATTRSKDQLRVIVEYVIGEHERLRRVLLTPSVEATPDSEISRVGPALMSGSIGWGPLEVDFLRSWLKPGERIARYDKWSASTDSGRTITRRELRDSMRPVNWTNRTTWDGQFANYPIDGRRE